MTTPLTLYKLLITACLTSFLSGLSAYAQQAPSEATNIRIGVDEKTKRIAIQYDLPRSNPNDSLYVEIETSSGKKFRPASVSGNVGRAISSGPNKIIYWDVVRDNVQLNDEDVEVLIRIVRTVPIRRPPVATRPTLPKPAPVVVQKKSPLPVIGWIATGGLAAYSFVLASGINKDVDAYKQNSVANTLPEWNAAEDKRKSIDSRRTIFTVVAGAAAVTLVANVVSLVARKSSSNQLTRPGQPRTAWQIQPASQSVGVALVHTF